MMKNLFSASIYLILILLSFAREGKAQNKIPKADSSFKALMALPDDTNKIKQLLSLGENLELSDTTTCKQVYAQCLSLSRKLHHPYLECKSLVSLGILRRTYGFHNQALTFYNQALRIALKQNIPKYIAVNYTNIANILLSQNQYEQAIVFYQNAIPYYEKIQDFKTASTNLANLANLFIDQSLLKKSLEYAEKSVTMAHKSENPKSLGIAYKALAVVQSRLGFDSASIQSALLSIRYFRKLPNPDPRDLFEGYKALAYGSMELKDFSLARPAADSLLVISKLGQDINQQAMAFLMKSKLERITSGNLIKCRKLMMDLKSILPQIRRWDSYHQYHYEVFEIERQAGNFKDAMNAYIFHSIYMDSIRDESVQKATLQMEKKFQTAQKQVQIEKLERNAQIADLKFTQKQRQVWTLLAISILLALLGLFIYISLKRKNDLVLAERQIQEHRIEQLEVERQNSILNGMIKGEENERNRMAQDLHDGLGSLLSGVKLSLTSMKGNAIMTEDQVHLFGHSLNQLDHAIQEMRRVAHNLMPSILFEYGLLAGVENLCNSINESAGEQIIHFEHFDFSGALSKDQEVVAYRMIQEAINNALKHAKASEIIVQLSQLENEVHLVVEDNGLGFDVNAAQKQTSGLQNLKNRVAYLKGKVEIQSTLGKGTTILIEFPIA